MTVDAESCNGEGSRKAGGVRMNTERTLWKNIPIGNPLLAIFFILFYMKPSELLSGDIRGRREGRVFSSKEQDAQDSQ